MTRFTGRPVSEGTAAGTLYIADSAAPPDATAEEVRDAFAAVAADREDLAERLRAAGRDTEAEIVRVAALIAADPALVEPAATAAARGSGAAEAVLQAAEAQAAVLAGLAVPELAERAGDVRQVARAVLDRLAAGPPRPAGDFILVRREVSPADLIELAESGLTGAVSVAGGGSSHAAIVARGLGLPMITGVDAGVLEERGGEPAMLDADAGALVIGRAPAAAPGPAAAEGNGAGPRQARQAGPAATTDGREITILANVASAAETRRGLACGAAGVGLLRTEIPFTGALAWPTAGEHRAQLAPILGLLAGRTATVRLLDFSGDKVPPFLQAPAAGGQSGLTALLAHRSALRDQLSAILDAGRGARLAVLIPMASSLGEVDRVRGVLAEAAAALGARPPRLGIMVELAATAAAAESFAPAVDFFSIGTNVLAGQVLGLDRRDPAARPALAADPRVLRLVAGVTGAGRRAGIGVSVCGDSAADPRVLPLLIGLGVDTLSVPAARVERVRGWVSALDAEACAALAGRALSAPTIEAVWKLVPAL